MILDCGFDVKLPTLLYFHNFAFRDIAASQTPYLSFIGSWKARRFGDFSRKNPAHFQYSIPDRAAVQAAKQAARAAGRIQFLFETPKQFANLLIVRYYSDQLIILQVREEKGFRMNEHWDWEDEESLSNTTNTVTSYSERELRAKKD
ncbi:unnamed protein product [Strongylus vulgaris]|uniref:Uncharacterized protein n=1 Tax=Strongylus vulgaris TaxID=40348 RepID=A0A3P7IWS5_STRVU|nr:unnamed protein product [Strongylus vulgaris]